MKSRLYLVMCFLIVGMMAQVSGGEPQKLDEKATPPKVLEKVNPVYPPEAKEKRIQGTVILEAMINEKGEVLEVKAQSGKEKALTDEEEATATADPILVKAAIDAVKQWKYEPYRDASGKALPVRFLVTIRFLLK